MKRNILSLLVLFVFISSYGSEYHYLKSVDGVLYYIYRNNLNGEFTGGGYSILVKYPAGKSNTTYKIPESIDGYPVKRIFHFAFKDANI